MNQEIKKKWLDALRSGDYLQARQRLRKERSDGEIGYCCLGVLCDLHRIETGEGQWVGGPISEYVVGSDHSPGTLPAPVRKWAGLGTGDPWISGKDKEFRRASEKNDKGASFKQIANMIEATIDAEHNNPEL